MLISIGISNHWSIFLQDLYRSILKDAGTSADNKFSSIALTNFIAGAAAGCTTLVLIYPLDIAHTRLAADIGRTDTRQFRGICHFVQTIYNKNGIRGIYRGLPASLQGMVVHRGLYFGGFDTAKDVMVPLDSPLWQRWVTAQAVTSMAGLISYPLDTVRRRMMMQSGMDVQMYSSTLDCWRKIYKVEGIKSFYRGALSNMFRSTGAAAILVLYDEVKKFMDRGRLWLTTRIEGLVQVLHRFLDSVWRLDRQRYREQQARAFCNRVVVLDSSRSLTQLDVTGALHGLKMVALVCSFGLKAELCFLCYCHWLYASLHVWLKSSLFRVQTVVSRRISVNFCVAIEQNCLVKKSLMSTQTRHLRDYFTQASVELQN